MSKADKARVFGIARGEMTEAIACVEVAGLLGVADAEEVERCVGIARELNAMLRALSR